MRIQYILLILLISTSIAQPVGDIVTNPPGMPDVSRIFSGYLQTKSTNRSIHYVLIQSQNDPVADPVVLWLNGGPGCSSLLGMLHEVGPYIVGNNYTVGDVLKRNPYSWTRNANMLFLESPAGVGFSINNQTSFNYTDPQTADDAFAALQYFFSVKFPNYAKSQFFISGQSYAGKYIPDLTVKILDSNAKKISSINLKGILVGNGVMDFQDDALEKSSIQYLIDHDFVSPHYYDIYKAACPQDWKSPRCRFFQYEIYSIRRNINAYNVYEVCTSATSEGSVLNHFVSKMKQNEPFVLNEIQKCPSDNGIIQYLNAHKTQYHVVSTNDWTPCTSISYSITPSGSLTQYRSIFINPTLKVWLYNGDWDDVVPYPDTLKGLAKLSMRPAGAWTPWFVKGNHAGFYQTYRGGSLTVVTVKGAGHMVPQNKREESFQMFYNFIKNKPINTDV